MRRRSPLFLLLGVPFLLSACGRLFGPPPRPRTDGYSALVTARVDGVELAKFRLWVRGEAVRRSTTDAEDAPYFVRETPQGPVFEVDPVAKTYREGNVEALLAHLDEFPLGADFNHAAEANRRGIKDYFRESDAVFAGNACAIWRYADVPDALNSPSTAYWTAPALDGIVVRKERRIPRPEGPDEKRFVELTLVRFGAGPELFRVPEGYRLEGGPAR
jgi:hypothetical protein